MIRRLKIVSELTKLKISAFAALSACAGFIVAGQRPLAELPGLILGVFLLACGSCALNQFQERETDPLMARTKGRPLVSGKLSPSAAVSIASGLILAGGLLLFRLSGWMSGGLGLLAVFWYNAVYTPLKRRTAFAAIPGALIGAIPPVLGWVSGGGGLLEPGAKALAFFFLLWQVPHFWLLLLDSGGDYERAGLPSLTETFSPVQLRRIVFVWIWSTAVSGLLIPFFGLLHLGVFRLLLPGGTLWLMGSALALPGRRSQGTALRSCFTRLNLYVLFVLSVLSLDGLGFRLSG